ncbi:MAG: DNA mismatch repair protein MutS [Bacteroidales bacterium]|nr:DNA mismatch repair protein MutS [Bacteroidales bacterium]
MVYVYLLKASTDKWTASMIFNHKKEKIENLLKAFGNLKEDSFRFEQIETYFLRKDHSAANQALSDKTCNDLDFNEIFMFIDRTSSKIGQQYLFDKLRVIPNDTREIVADENLIREFTNNSDLRVYIQRLLCKLNSKEAFYISALFQEDHIEQPKWYFLVPILALTSLLSLISAFFIPKMFFVILGIFLINMGIHYWNKQNIYEYLVSLPQLIKLNSVARELFKNDILKQTNPNLTKSIAVLDKVRNRMSFFQLEAKLQNDFEAVFWAFLELFKILFLLEPLLLFGVLKRLDTKRKEIEELFRFVGKIDALISISSLRKGLDKYCIPDINPDQRTLIAQNIYHPLIDDCVLNSIQVKGKSILLTGSNMSGKTTFIRTIGINAITGLTINTCFADHFSMPGLRIFSAVRISDDLMNDKSYYFEEVVTIKEMIDNSVNEIPNLFLLDEIFKGTNTVERISAGKAVLSSLAMTGNIVFVSTHDIELADLLKEDFDLYHFSEKVDNKTVDFDYKLKVGKLKNRNAIRILQINDYPENIIKEALEIAMELDKKTIIQNTI